MNLVVRSTLRSVATILCITFIGLTAAHAQATRTWVSGVGDDANPCSRTAPCKTFAGTISKTAAGGEISVLDPGGFGAVTITKSITIDGTGQVASILAAGTNGVIINGPGITVALRNIEINGASTGINGIRFLDGDSLFLDNVKIENFTQTCIEFLPSALKSSLAMNNVALNNCSNSGVNIIPTASGSADVSINNSQINHSGRGVYAEDRSQTTIKNTSAHGNVGAGFISVGFVSAAEMNITSSSSSGNGAGIKSSGSLSKIRISDSIISNNSGFGLLINNAGSVISYGTNNFGGNILGDGAPTSTTSTK